MTHLQNADRGTQRTHMDRFVVIPVDNEYVYRGMRNIHTSMTDNIKLLPAKKHQPSSKQDVYHKKNDNTPQLLTLPTSCSMTSSPFIWLYDWEQHSQIVSATIYQKTHNIIGDDILTSSSGCTSLCIWYCSTHRSSWTFLFSLPNSSCQSNAPTSSIG